MNDALFFQPVPKARIRVFLLRVAAMMFFLIAGAKTVQAQSIQITQLTTSITGTKQNLSGLKFEHDLVPATPIALSTVVAGFPSGTDPKLANVIKIIEDGQIVAVLSAPTTDDFANNSTNNISYTPASPGVKSLVVQATNGTTTVSSAAVTVYVYGIAIDQPVENASSPANSDLFVSASTLLRNGVVATVQFYVDGTSIGTDASAPYAVAWRPTVAGSYTVTARLTSSAGATVDSPSRTSTVVPAVSNGTLSVSLTSPTSGSTVAAGTTVTLSADAKLTNSSGTISQVQFYVNGVALGDPVTAFPYTTTWTPTVAGNYTVTAIATDDKSNARVSTGAVVSVTGNVPSVFLVNPADNAIVLAGSGVSLTAVPTGQDGSTATVSSIEFFVDGNSVGSVTAAPYAVVWTPIQARTTPYTITARVTATNGATASSSAVSVTVISASSGPTISLSTSYGSASVPAGKTVTLTAIAADQTGSAATVAQVDFYVEGTLIGTATSSPFTATWTPVVPRTDPYSLRARVTLKSGLTAYSSEVLVQVVANAAPTVSISSPIDGQTVTLGTALTLSATAGDTDGSIASVQFFANNAATGSAVTTSPYSISFVPSTVGTYVLRARATDDTGNSTFSAVVTITVKAPVGLSPTAYIGILPNNTTNTVEKIFTAGSLISIGVSANDADGMIARVTLYYDGSKIATFTGAPYASTLQLASSSETFSEHTISAIVEDNDGNQTSAAESIVVVSSSRTLPAVTLSAPTAGSIYNYGAAITVTALLSGSATNVSGVVFAENGVEIETVTASPYTISYVPGSSGAKSITAIAYYNWTWTIETVSGSTTRQVSYAITTTAGATAGFTVKDFSPTSDAESFVSQTYQDLLQRAATTAEISAGATALSAGTLTRAQLAANLVNSSGFDDGFEALAAAWIITGQWPTYTNYAAAVATIRANDLATECGVLLASNEYVAAYGTTPTLTSLTGTNSYANLKTFVTQLYQNAYGRDPSLAEIQAAGYATSTSTQAGGITVVGLNQFLAEFVAKNSSTIAARVRTAGLYLGLLRTQPTAATVTTLAAQTLSASASSLLGETSYAARFLLVSRQPQSLVLAPGATGLLQAEASGTGPFGYQWFRNGVLVAGGTRATLVLRDAAAATAGSYYVVITSTSSRVVSSAATVTVAAGSSRLANLSSRAYAGSGDNTLIAGFVIEGSGTKRLLLRGVGPGLVSQGVSGALADPKVELNSTSAAIATNDNWSASTDAATLASVASQVGAFSLTAGSKDAAILATPSNGIYTLLTSNASGSEGIALAEIYDAGADTDATRLANISSRAFVGTGDQAMIAGFVIGGKVSKRVLLRAVGPGLLTLGVQGSLAQPSLTLTSGGAVIATNENWTASPDAALISSVGAQVGAFSLVAGNLDSAIIVSLPPGVYSAVVTGVGGATGIALVEVYDADL